MCGDVGGRDLSTPVEAGYVRKVAEIIWVKGVEHSIKALPPQQFASYTDCGEAISQDAVWIKATAEQHGYSFKVVWADVYLGAGAVCHDRDEGGRVREPADLLVLGGINKC